MCDGTAFKIRGRVVTSMAAWVRMSVSMVHALLFALVCLSTVAVLCCLLCMCTKTSVEVRWAQRR